MTDPVVKRIDEIPYYEGPDAIPGIRFHSAGRELGVTARGMNVLEIDSGCTGYPEHDHVKDGQEEVYVVLEGSGSIECDGTRIELAKGMLARVNPSTRRRTYPGPDGITVLPMGESPGKPYAARSQRSYVPSARAFRPPDPAHPSSRCRWR